jgi:uncharacterized protein involved in exopolysaccharide biosynthesis
MFWKHWLLFIFIWALISVAGVAVTYSLPNVYQARAVILVESQRIPEKFVSTTINDDLQARLSSLSQQILSGTRLLQIVEKYDLYHKERLTRPQEEIIEMMRRDIGTQIETSWAKKADSRPSAFRISYEAPNPTVAALVAQNLATLFIDENLQAREVQAAGTSEFLASQLGEAGRRLEEQEKKLGEYKLAHRGELPEQENALIAASSQLQVRLQGLNDGVERAEQTRKMQESALASARATETAMQQLIEQLNTPQPSASSASSSFASSPAEPVKTSERLQRQLEQLLVRYTDDFPDVQSLRSLIVQARNEEERKEKEQREAQARAKTGKPADGAVAARVAPESSVSLITPLPQVRNERALQLSEVLIRGREQAEQLKAQQKLASEHIEVLNAEQKKVVAQLDEIQKAIGQLPVREQQLASIKRDYEMSRANYQSLLDKKLAAEMATEMERRQKSERFTIIDQARPPERPIKPNRPLLCGLGSFVGLLLGAGLALGRELKKNTILGEWELPKGVPMLGRIPRVVPAVATSLHNGRSTRKRVRLKLRLALICSSALLVIAVVAGFYVGHFGYLPW